MEFSHNNLTSVRKALPVQVSHSFKPDSAVFDDDNLVSCAGLVPVMTLATQTGLSELLADKVHIAEPRIKSGCGQPGTETSHRVRGHVCRRRQHR